MKKIAKILALVLSILMLVGCVAGCNNEQTPGNTDGSKPQGTVGTGPVDYKDTEFMVAWWGADARHNNTMAALEEFDKLQPNLKTSVKYTGWADYYSMIDIDIAGNTAPDVYQMVYERLKTYVEAGKILKLDDYIADGTLDMSNVSQTTLNLGACGDGIYAIPTGTNCTVYVYSTADAAAAGVTLSRTPTLDEMVDAAKKVYDKTGKKIVLEFAEYVRMCGESYYNEDGTAVGFSSKTLADWWAFELEGMEYGFLPKPEDGIDGGKSGMTDGKVWCCPTYSNQVGAMETDTDLDLEWTAVPHTDINPATSFTQPNTLWVISAQTANPRLALELVNFFTNNEKFYEKCGVDRGMPISSAIMDYLEPNMSEDQKLQASILEEMAELNAFGPMPNTSSRDSEAKTELEDYMQQNRYGYISESDRMAYAEEAIQVMNEAISG